MTVTTGASATQNEWPRLPLSEWGDTLDTLHRWVQMIGKTRLALAPPINHWWHVALYPSARGLTTSAMPYHGTNVEIELDFIDHQLYLRCGNGKSGALALEPKSVARFFQEYTDLLRSLDLQIKLWPVPNEMDDALPFREDEQHRSYDPDAATRCWQAITSAAQVLGRFRGRFIGKCSPVHFFWGGFDLACTRFSGREAPTHPGGVPHLPDRVAREAYSHECSSAGWWAGSLNGPVAEPAFYSYAYAEPEGYAEARVRPDEAYYSKELREFILPYEVVRQARRPDAVLMDFLQTTYETAADLGGWQRQKLERRSDDEP